MFVAIKLTDIGNNSMLQNFNQSKKIKIPIYITKKKVSIRNSFFFPKERRIFHMNKQINTCLQHIVSLLHSVSNFEFFIKCITLYLRRCLTRKYMCEANGCLILINMVMKGMQTSNENPFHVPLNRFQMKIQILLSNFE